MEELFRLYNAANAANSEMLRIANEIQIAMELHTDAGFRKAVGMRKQLDKAITAVQTARDKYLLKRKNMINATKFYPIGNGSNEPIEKKKEITRAEYEALDYQARHDFFANGGQVVDELEE